MKEMSGEDYIPSNSAMEKGWLILGRKISLM